MQSLETKSSRPRPKSFETETRPRLQKTGLETRLETETESRHSITGMTAFCDTQVGIYQLVSLLQQLEFCLANLALTAT